MKPRTLLLSSILLVGFLGYKLWSSESDEPQAKDQPKALMKTAAPDEGSVEDLDPSPVEKPTLEQNSRAREETPPEREEAPSAPIEVPQEPMVNPETGIIKVKVPPETEGKPSIVNLVNADSDTVIPERERLDNVQASFDEGKDAVKVFGDALNAINGTYNGELQREGKDPCPLSLVIDGLYSPTEGGKQADFTGNFVMSFDCPGEGHSKGQFDGQFGSHAKAIGENANTLVLKDNGDTYFQLSFSSDFQRVSGHAYQTPTGAQTRYAGKISAHR